MWWGGSFLADSSCTALICFTTAPFDQSLVTTCLEGIGAVVPTPIASVFNVGLEETFGIRLAYCWFREEEEIAVFLFDPFLGGGWYSYSRIPLCCSGRRCHRGLLWESSCFLPWRHLCWHRFAGVLPGWHGIDGDNQCGKNCQMWYFMGVRSRQVWYFMGVIVILCGNKTGE